MPWLLRQATPAPSLPCFSSLIRGKLRLRKESDASLSDQETLEQQLRRSAGLEAPSLPLPPCPELLLPWSLCTAFLLVAADIGPCHPRLLVLPPLAMLQVLRGTWHIAELQPILIVLWWLRRGVFDTLLSHLVPPCAVSQSEQMEIVGLSVRGTLGAWMAC